MKAVKKKAIARKKQIIKKQADRSIGTEIFQYLKTPSGRKVGILLAKKSEKGKVGIGWSKCKIKLDDFTGLGLEIARGRAERVWKKKIQLNTIPCPEHDVNTPQIVRDNLEHFAIRARKFFKKDKIRIYGESGN